MRCDGGGKMKKFALAGNPNCGKTTLFNLLTGSTAYVGQTGRGVTVEKREGTYKKGCGTRGSSSTFPGIILALALHARGSHLAQLHLGRAPPDCVINIVDATNLERNLDLTTQLMEIDVPMGHRPQHDGRGGKGGRQGRRRRARTQDRHPRRRRLGAARHGAIKELMDRAIKASKTPRKGATVLEDSPVAHLVKDVFHRPRRAEGRLSALPRRQTFRARRAGKQRRIPNSSPR